MTSEKRSTPARATRHFPPASRLSWFPFYVDNFRGGTDRMTNAEVGQYVRLMMAQWDSKDEKSIPADPADLRFICRGEAPTSKVLQKFEPQGPCLRNERLAGEWERALAIRNQRAEAGRQRAAKQTASEKAAYAERVLPPSQSQLQEQKTETVTRTRKRTSGGKPPVPTWVNEACDDWNAQHGDHTAPGGRIGKGLKLIVDSYGWSVIRPAWQRYLQGQDAVYQTPQDFASKLGLWLDKHIGAGPKDKRVEAGKAAIKQWLEEN